MEYYLKLPDFLIFEEDLDKRNIAHCYYLMGLGNIGLGNVGKAREAFSKTLECDPTNLNAIIYKKQAVEMK